jgi:hypothetical protein
LVVVLGGGFGGGFVGWQYMPGIFLTQSAFILSF